MVNSASVAGMRTAAVLSSEPREINLAAHRQRQRSALHPLTRNLLAIA